MIYPTKNPSTAIKPVAIIKRIKAITYNHFGSGFLIRYESRYMAAGPLITAAVHPAKVW